MKINMSLCVLATLIMAVLKLTEVIAWSWWIVAAPVIASVALTTLAFGILGIAALIVIGRK